MRKLLVAALFPLLTFLALPAIPAAATHADFCENGMAVVHGTDSADTITHGGGFSSSECIDTKDGNDHFTSTNSWGDYALLGAGDDTGTAVGAAWQTISGMSGSDDITADGGRDVLYGGGGSGTDTIHGGSDSDTLFGAWLCSETGTWGFANSAPIPTTPCASNDGSDYLYGQAGQDWLWDSNSDQFSDGHPDTLNGGDGGSVCVGPHAADCKGGDNWDVCTGGAEDTFVGCEETYIVPTYTP